MTYDSRPAIRGSVEVAGADVLHEERASDTDRDQAITLLGQHYRDGRITDDIYHARMTAMSTAVTRAKLAALMADLPAPPVPRQRRWRPWLVNPLTALTASALWGALIPIALMTLTGHRVTYTEWGYAMSGVAHPGWATVTAFFFIITGSAGVIASTIWLITGQVAP